MVHPSKVVGSVLTVMAMTGFLPLLIAWKLTDWGNPIWGDSIIIFAFLTIFVMFVLLVISLVLIGYGEKNEI